MTDDNVTPAPEEEVPSATSAEAPAEVPAEPVVPAAEEPVLAPETPMEPAADEPAAPEPIVPPVAPEPPAPPAPPQYAPPPPPQPPYAAAPVAPAAASDKSKVVAGVLGILLGSLGIHKFYLGYNKEGIIMLAVSLLSFGFLAWITSIIGLIEGILYLVKTDEEFVATYVTGRKGWF